NRGLIFILLNLTIAKLFIFINKLFINNANYTLKLSYIIILINKKQTNESFIINNNIIYYSSIKSKRITQSVLVLKVYKIVININVAYTILTTLDLITK
ncbi:uncharacterized protein CLUP02_07087, partial [Colletotrichum lupini]